jgi:hypothetical protein
MTSIQVPKKRGSFISRLFGSEVDDGSSNPNQHFESSQSSQRLDIPTASYVIPQASVMNSSSTHGIINNTKHPSRVNL